MSGNDMNIFQMIGAGVKKIKEVSSEKSEQVRKNFQYATEEKQELISALNNAGISTSFTDTYNFDAKKQCWSIKNEGNTTQVTQEELLADLKKRFPNATQEQMNEYLNNMKMHYENTDAKKIVTTAVACAFTELQLMGKNVGEKQWNQLSKEMESYWQNYRKDVNSDKEQNKHLKLKEQMHTDYEQGRISLEALNKYQKEALTYENKNTKEKAKRQANISDFSKILIKASGSHR